MEEPLEFPMEPIARIFAKCTIFICLFLVFGNLAANAYYNPERAAVRETEYLAKDYYENYYYDQLVTANSDKSLADIFGKYEETGFPRVYLRELLLFDNGRHAAERGFYTDSYVCNTNHTAIIITPYRPYGKTDYKVKYEYECQWANKN